MAMLSQNPKAVDLKLLTEQLFLVIESCKAAMNAVRAYALRSVLTTLGIVIGVAAVVTVVAIMHGLGTSIASQLDDFGSDTITLTAITSIDDELLGKVNTLHHEDFLYLKDRVPEVEHMTATASFSSKVQYGRKSSQTLLYATDSSYKNVVNIYPKSGRLPTYADDERRRRVALVGASLIEKLNLPTSPIGEFVKVSGDWFLIVGVAESRGEIFGLDQDNFIIAPFNTMLALNGESAAQDVEIMFRPSVGIDAKKIQEKMRHLLRHRMSLEKNELDPFEFKTAEKIKAQFDDIARGVTIAAVSVVGVSLLVAGIGIMNIMLVSVTERTRDIGILKALGASPNFILLQFLLEATLTSVSGGLLGLLLGYFLANFLVLFIPNVDAVVVPVWAMQFTLGFTTIIGIGFGMLPALKASRLNPIDALRYE